jgi:hypothetical protein
MFINEGLLEVLVGFSLVGFAFSMFYLIKYAWLFGQWITIKALNKLFGERVT